MTFLWTNVDCPGASFDDATSDMPMLTMDTSQECQVDCTVMLAVTAAGETTACETAVSITDTNPACFSVTRARIETKDRSSGNKVDVSGSLGLAVPIDLDLDDVTLTIDDGRGSIVSLTIPAGSFELDGEPEKQKFVFRSPPDSELYIDAKLELLRCKFRFKAEGVQGTSDFTGTNLNFVLQVDRNVGQETIEMLEDEDTLRHEKDLALKCCSETR